MKTYTNVFVLFFCLFVYSLELFSQTAIKIDSLGLSNLYQIDKGIFRSEQPFDTLQTRRG